MSLFEARRLASKLEDREGFAREAARIARQAIGHAEEGVIARPLFKAERKAAEAQTKEIEDQ